MGAPAPWGGGHGHNALQPGACALQGHAQSGPTGSHKKPPEALPAFQAACVERLPQVIPSATTAPVRGFRQDESRFGRLPVRRRRLTVRGVQPSGRVHYVRTWSYVDGAAEPRTGDRFFLAWPSPNAEGCPIFADAFAAALPERLNLLVLDNSGAPAAQRLTLPAHVRPVCLPPDCPELNPTARVWRALQDTLAWLQCPTLDV